MKRGDVLLWLGGRRPASCGGRKPLSRPGTQVPGGRGLRGEKRLMFPIVFKNERDESPCPLRSAIDLPEAKFRVMGTVGWGTRRGKKPRDGGLQGARKVAICSPFSGAFTRGNPATRLHRFSLDPRSEKNGPIGPSRRKAVNTPILASNAGSNGTVLVMGDGLGIKTRGRSTQPEKRSISWRTGAKRASFRPRGQSGPILPDGSGNGWAWRSEADTYIAGRGDGVV